MKFRNTLSVFIFGTLMLSGCLGGKKLTEKSATVPKPKVTASTKSSSPARERKRPAITPKSESKSEPKTSSNSTVTEVPKPKAVPEQKHNNKVVSIKDGVTIEKGKESVKSFPDNGRKRKAAFESKSMCALEPVQDWYYSFAPDVNKTFTQCKTYPPEANYIKYLDKQALYEVGELNRKVVTKNTKGVLEYAVPTGEIVSQICFNQEGTVVAVRVLECSSNYDYLRLTGFKEALLGYKWSENKSAAPIECMKHFFSTTMN